MRKIIVSTIITVFIVASCKQPVADFTWSPREPVAGEAVKFTNLSLNAKSYSWNFGDMTIGSKPSPTHIYERSGAYIIDLRAHNGLINSDSCCEVVDQIKNNIPCKYRH